MSSLYSNNDWRDYKSLEHHGIIGQRWGKKNGPPYPLDPADHSASERKAGWRKSLSGGDSTSSSSKERKGLAKIFGRKSDPKQQEDKNNNSSKIKGVTFSKGATGIVANSEEIRKAGIDLAKKASDISDQFNDLTNEYDKEIKALKSNEKFKSDMVDKVKNDWGIDPDTTDDEDLIDMAAFDIVFDNMHDYFSKELSAKSLAMDKAFEDYYKEMDKSVDSIVKENGDTKVAGDTTYKNAVERTLAEEGDSGWVHYLRNHKEMAYIENDGIDDLVSEVATRLKDETRAKTPARQAGVRTGTTIRNRSRKGAKGGR